MSAPADGDVVMPRAITLDNREWHLNSTLVPVEMVEVSEGCSSLHSRCAMSHPLNSLKHLFTIFLHLGDACPK